MRRALGLLAGFCVVLATGWGTGALYYSDLVARAWRAPLALAFAGGTLLCFMLLRNRRQVLLGFSIAFALLLFSWLRIEASNDRSWQPDVAVTPWADVDGDLVTIHGVRNLEYRTEDDFDAHWEDRTYDLRDLDSVDLVASYWSGRDIAHIFLSFGFAGDHLAISIETRKELGEAYSTWAGFFRQYELVYVVADERDLIRVRTNYRRPPEDVHLYRLRRRPEAERRLFMDYIRSINDMRDHPRFYNTLTTNCTTGILLHSRVNPESPPMSWKVLLSGHVPEYLYELERVDQSLPFAELERISRVNDRAREADGDPEFSRRIREGLPVPPVHGGD